MPFDVPDGFHHYADVLLRIGEVRRCGQGVSFRCLYPERHKNGDAHWSGWAKIGLTGNLVAGCFGCGATWEELVEAVGLPKSEWFPDKGRNRLNGGRAATPFQRRDVTVEKPAAVYPYRDADGVVAFEKLRYEPKAFAQRRPLDPRHRRALGIPENAGEVWVWGLLEGEYGRPLADGRHDLHPLNPKEHQASVRLPECWRGLYRLPELLSANPDSPVFLVEGEKEVEMLRRLGFVATCTPNGSASLAWDWLAPLAGRRVVVVPDNDVKGRGHATSCAGVLVSGGARSVRVLWPGEGGYDVPEAGDLSVWLADNPHPKEAVVALAKKFPEYRY